VFEWIDPVVNQIATHADDIIVIQMGFLCIVTTIFLWLWNSNRKKYNNLKHAIPADVVKSYLDSIIMNSTSLKSQLFRGGGLESNGVPSVLPLQSLTGGEGLAISGAPSTALLEELNQKKAQVAALEAQLSSFQSSQREVESKLGQSQNSLIAAQGKISELEGLLAQNREGSGADEALKTEINMITKERNDLRDRLKEFEIIADDLANLKRLQQENEQLKRSLAAQGGTVLKAPLVEDSPAAPPTAEVNDLFEEISSSQPQEAEDTQPLDDFLAAPEENVSDLDKLEKDILGTTEPQTPAAQEIPAALTSENPLADLEPSKAKIEKTPEDLLSEFEKMLG
jgi:DNA repair exonuclease SbcCD ATPase subunit